MSQNATKTSTEPITAQLAKLDESVEWFYGDEFNLDQAIDKYKSALELSQHIEKELQELKNQVAVLADFTKD